MRRMDEAQRALVKNHVNMFVSYYETAQELTDHIITAIEDRDLLPEEVDSDTLYGAINAVVKEGFGGFANIMYQEEDRTQHFFENYRTVYLQSYAAWFKRPYIWFLIAVFLSGLYFSYNVLAEKQIQVLVVLGMMLIPLLAIGVYWLSYYGKKPSIKQKALMNYGLLPTQMTNFIVFGLDVFLPFENSILVGYPYSFIFSGTLITLSILTTLNTIDVFRREIRVLAVK